MESATAVTDPVVTASASKLLASNANLVGSAWMLSSAILTTYSTTRFLKYDSGTSQVTSRNQNFIELLPRPTMLTLYRFGGSFMLGILAHPDLRVWERVQDTLQSLADFSLPAVFLFVANFSNAISLSRIGVSLTYTSKCAIPLVTVFLTILLDGKKALPGTLTLLSLVPIALGIAAASWDSPHFELLGFAAAMISCTAQSALNVSSKRAMTKTGVSGSQAQRAMVAVGFVVAVVYAAAQAIASSQVTSEKKEEAPPAWLASLAVYAYHVEYVLSFMFVKLVAPITYGACDAIRRLSIILSGHFMFGGHPFTILNKCGIALALLGALLYSIASHSGK